MGWEGVGTIHVVYLTCGLRATSMPHADQDARCRADCEASIRHDLSLQSMLHACALPANGQHTLCVVGGAETPSGGHPAQHQRLLSPPACGPQTPTRVSPHPTLPPCMHTPPLGWPRSHASGL